MASLDSLADDNLTAKQRSKRKRDSVKIAAGENLLAKFPGLAAEWDPELNGGVSAADIAPSSRWKAWWRCAAGLHKPFLAQVANRTGRRSGCPDCGIAAGLRTRRVALDRQAADGHNLADKYPEIAAELVVEDGPPASAVLPGSHHFRLWRCKKCGHEYRNSPAARCLGTKQGCPPCGVERKAVATRKRASMRAAAGHSVADLSPHLVPEWSTKNVLGPHEVTNSAHIPIEWDFPCGHTKTMIVAKRTNKERPQGCPVCGGRAVADDCNFLVGDARKQIPPAPAHLLAEWDYERNEGGPETYTPGSNKAVWWICQTPGCSKRSWKKEIVARRAGVDCKDCSLGGRSKTEIHIAFELAHFFPDVDPKIEHRLSVPGYPRPQRLDAVLDHKRMIAFEYDGIYFHRGENKGAKDEKRAQALADLGWTVIYAREFNNQSALPLLTEHSFKWNGLHAWVRPHEVAQEVLRRAVVMGILTPSPDLDLYLAGNTPIAKEAADAFCASKRRRKGPYRGPGRESAR